MMRLIHGDCLEEMALLESGSVDMVIGRSYYKLMLETGVFLWYALLQKGESHD